MIPLVANGTRKLYAWAANSIFAATYRRYLGSAHRTAARKLRRLALLQAVREGIRLLRMRYLAAWRLWKYDPRYRNSSGGALGQHVRAYPLVACAQTRLLHRPAAVWEQADPQRGQTHHA